MNQEVLESYEYQIDRKKRKRTYRWSKQEYLVYNILIKHYGNDYRIIADEMNKTFFNKVFRPHFIKETFDSQDPNKIRNLLTVDEAEQAFEIFCVLIKKKRPHIWKTIQKKIQHRSVALLAKRFMMVIVKLLRRFNFFYGSEKSRYFYHHRVQTILQCTINMLFFMGTTNPSCFEQKDSLLMVIWDACQKMFKMIKLMFDMKMIDKDEPQHYVDPKVFLQMPWLSEEEFSGLMEPILLLDTINRICFGMTPYRLTKIKQEVVQLKENIKIIDSDEMEVPPILVEQKHGNIVFEKDKHNPYVKSKENFYPRLTYNQIRIIQVCPTVQMLIPLQTVMYQHWVQVQPMSI